MSNVNQLVTQYIAAWNERAANRRRDIIASTWTEDGTYVDAARRGNGHQGIDQMIEAVQQHFAGYQFRLVSGIETHNGYVRFTWAAGGTPDAPLYFRGTDFGVIGNDGRFKSVTGFTDAKPAPVT